MARPDPKYDIVLNNLGFMLARKNNERGPRMWRVDASGASIAEQSPTEARYGNQPATVEMPMVWKTAHLGYGDEETRVEGRYHYANNVDARFANQVIPGPLVTTIETTTPTANVSKFIEYDGKLFFLGGRYVPYILPADDSINASLDLGAGKAGVDMEAFNGILYVSQGYGSGDYIYSKNGTGAWAEDADVQAGHMTVLKNRLYAASGTAKVRWVESNPVTIADWSAEYTVGDPGTAITSIAMLGDLLYVGKRDGLYALDSSGIGVPLTPELRNYVSTSNCAGMVAWHGTLWVPHLRGLLNYQNLGDRGNLVISVGPGRGSVRANKVSGRVTALCGDDRWLYAAIYTEANETYILAGREGSDSEPEAVIWHPIAKFADASTPCYAMTISGLWSTPRLWMGYGTDVAYLKLPAYADNPLRDSNYRYARSGSLYYSRHNWGSPTTLKVWKSIAIEADNLSSTRYFSIYYRIDGGSWVNAGRAIRSPRTVLKLSDSGVSGAAIELRLDYSMDSTSNPIVLRSLVVTGAERPAQVDQISMGIRCVDNLKCNDGSTDRRSAATMLGQLKNLATLGQAVTLKDTIGSTRYVLVQPGVTEQEIAREGNLYPEMVATVRASVFGVTQVVYEEFNFAIGGGSGSFAIPWAIPWAIGTTTLGGSQSFPYSGGAPTQCILIIGGPIANAVITNTTTGKSVNFTGTTIAAGDAYTIDMTTSSPTVLDAAGIDRSANEKAGQLEDFNIAAGENMFTLAGTSITAATYIKLLYVVKDN